MFILLITKVIDRKAIIKKDNKTIPKDLKLDFKFKISFFFFLNVFLRQSAKVKCQSEVRVRQSAKVKCETGLLLRLSAKLKC